MHIPEPSRAFSKPTLIVVTDNVQAKLFLANGRDVGLIHTIETKLEPMKDLDRIAIKRPAGVRVSGEQHEDNQDWTREQLYDRLSADLMKRLQNKEFADLVFTVPEENENELKESLHIDLLKRAKAFVPKLLTKDDLVDIVGHVQEVR